MLFERPLVAGRLLRRYKRFFADVALDGGPTVTAHCPNPGSMRTCLAEGGRVWLRPADDPKRRLAWTWELAELDGELVVINTARANRVVEEALVRGGVAELAAYDRVTREPPARAGPGSTSCSSTRAGGAGSRSRARRWRRAAG